MKRPSLAPGTAALLVLLPPMIFFCIPDIYYDAALIAWARLKLTRDFRRSVSEQYSQVATV